MKRIAGVLILALAATAMAGAAPTASSKPQTAIFAGGCFWSMQSAFEKVYGVMSVTSGYTAGKSTRPSYETYAAAGHVEAVLVMWDPSRVSYGELLDTYWRHTDPTDGGGQFVDRGPQYRPIVFWSNDQQRSEAEASKAALGRSHKFAVPIVPRSARRSPSTRRRTTTRTTRRRTRRATSRTSRTPDDRSSSPRSGERTR